MINKRLTYAIIIGLVLIFLSIFLWKFISIKYFINQAERPEKTIIIPPSVKQKPDVPINNSQPNSEKCGIENCHGVDVTCGPNVPEMCTMSYMIGDGCRNYASCEKKDGKCQLVNSSKFESCKSCVEKCESDFGENDPDKLFTCESSCVQ